MTDHSAGPPPCVSLPRAQLSVLFAAAMEAFPNECCGGLLGRVIAGGYRIERVVPVSNEAETAERRYLIGPDRMRRLENVASRGGLDLLGFFHSHPDGAAVPSRSDRACAWPRYLYAIVPVPGGRADAPRIWLLRDDRTCFDSLPLSIAEADVVTVPDRR